MFMPQTPSVTADAALQLTARATSLSEGGYVWAFPYVTKVGFAVGVYGGRGDPSPTEKMFVCII